MMENKGIGVLLVNLGTPDEATPAAVKRFLGEFLSDPRVVDLSKWLWRPALYGAILPVRSPKVAKLYQSIWLEEGSPLMVYSQRQRDALEERLNIPVALGMTYGNPSIQSALSMLSDQGCRKVIVLPLYPQYSRTTTAAVFDKVARSLQQTAYLPELRFINHYQDHPGYISALAESVTNVWAEHGEPDYLLCSYHGIPKRYADLGDPYPEHCNQTTALLAEALAMPREKMSMSYQSIFGREEWLKPYTEPTIIELAKKGIKRLDVVCPAFSVDCLETIEEIAEGCKDAFINAGGETFNLIPCLNDNSAHIAMMETLVRQHTQGW